MATDLIVSGFIAENEGLQFYNGKAVINLVFAFYYDDEDETEFDFTDDSGSYFFRVLDERSGRELKEYNSQVTRNSNRLIMNCSVSDMTFEDIGTYYYEMGYIRSGGYEELLRFGEIIII
jgi:hypothetical protein